MSRIGADRVFLIGIGILIVVKMDKAQEEYRAYR